MAKITERIDGADAFQRATKLARYGHRDWLYWRDANGSHAARRSPENIKAMLLAVGLRGSWSLISADTATPVKGFWWLGINIWRQSKMGLC